MEKLKFIKNSEGFNNGQNGLIHCESCNYYSIQDLYELPKDRNIMIRFRTGRDSIWLCKNCVKKINEGYVIVAKKGGCGGKCLKNFVKSEELNNTEKSLEEENE